MTSISDDEYIRRLTEVAARRGLEVPGDWTPEEVQRDLELHARNLPAIEQNIFDTLVHINNQQGYVARRRRDYDDARYLLGITDTLEHAGAESESETAPHMVVMSPSPAPSVRYSFNFRYQPEQVRSIDIPIERLDGIAFDVEALWAFLTDDVNADLLSLLLGDFLAEYRSMYEQSDLYWKSISRFNESAVIVSGQ